MAKKYPLTWKLNLTKWY